MNTLPISVIILAFADEVLSPQLLKSTEWADEVMVVRNSEKIQDFAVVRNDSAKKAKHDILFFVDSDEVVEEASVAKIRTLIDRSDWAGANILRRDIFLGREMRWGEVRHVKIVRVLRKGAFHFQRAVHEIAIVDGKVIDSGIVIYHHPHSSISAFFSKILNYIQLEFELRKKEQQQVTPFALFAWPTGKFLSNYVVKLGFLDGWQGLIYAGMMSLHSFGLRAMLYESHHEK